MRRGRGAGLAGLAALLLVAVGRAQVQQEPSAETTEDTGIAINCSHPSIQNYDFIYWYRQLPGRGPAFITSGHKGSREVQDPPGRMSVAADRRSSALWLARPRRRDAAVYYCAVGDTGLGAGAAAGHEPRRPGPGVCVGDAWISLWQLIESEVEHEPSAKADKRIDTADTEPVLFDPEKAQGLECTVHKCCAGSGLGRFQDSSGHSPDRPCPTYIMLWEEQKQFGRFV
ncbi:uncharacterized protein LOC119146333 [Falco rusticolus]|uniref:uncharacterized protein LOC119146333 n=1 Tax=Falco rusticolus TaxID=120794 RepID=UPI001886608B|nr:uncharacterized protein LOC119146333 [Falco rusticolus]